MLSYMNMMVRVFRNKPLQNWNQPLKQSSPKVLQTLPREIGITSTEDETMLCLFQQVTNKPGYAEFNWLGSLEMQFQREFDNNGN